MERDLELSQEKFLEGPLLLQCFGLEGFSRLKVIVPKTN